MLIKNKRGDASIVLVVFLTLFITVTSLYSFSITNKKIIDEISGAGIMNNVELKNNLAEFYLHDAIESSMVETYKTIVLQGKYAGEPRTYIVNDIQFGNLNQNLNEDFNRLFKENFKRKFNTYNLGEEYLINLKELVNQEKFTSSLNQGKMLVVVSGFEIKEPSDKTNVTSSPSLSTNVDLNNLGLDNFEKVYSVKESCKVQKEQEILKQCLENGLKGFNVNVFQKVISQNEKYFIVTLTSKKEFFINSNFEQIKYNFVLA